MKTKFFYIVLIAVLSISTLNVQAGSTKGKKIFRQKNNTGIYHLINVVKETEFEIESWMTSTIDFNNESEIFVEEPIQIEDWMTKVFTGNNNTNDFQEDELILEGWMLESFDTKTQEISTEKELELESWMSTIL